MEIQRIDTYSDDRFSQTVLNQHGAYWIAGNPYEIEIVGRDTAIVRGADPAAFRELIETFRFHAPHITRYLDQRGERLAEYDRVELLTVGLDGIQPSQFFVDEEKLRAVKTFVHHADDIVIQVLPWEGRFVSLDGHTRLYLAAKRGYDSVCAVVSETDDYIWTFVREAQKRGITCPRHMKLLSHEQYELQWNQYCDSVFGG